MAARNKILVLNAGSSSLKFKVFELGPGSTGAAAGAAAAATSGATGSSAGSSMVPLHPISAGLCERIGDPAGDAVMRAVAGSDRWRDGERVTEPMPDHGAALRLVSRFFQDSFSPSFQREVLGVGHRVVHGGTIGESVLIDEQTRTQLQEVCRLAPLHNPPNLHCIEAAQRRFPDAPHVAVFDTTFHQTMPLEAYTYALPAELCRKHGIRRYGFHGISYSYLTHAAAGMLGRPASQVNLIICHLGAGSSMCAVQGGVSIETTMGFTPLEGLMMGSRCGDIDPAIVPYLIAHGMSAADVDALMNKQSGFLGLAGSIDVRTIEECALAGDQACQLALAVYVRRIRKYLGAYMVHLGGTVDAIVFSAGVGENGSIVREQACQGLEWAGIELDKEKNDVTVRGKSGEVQAAGGRVKVLVIPTDEQLEIAEQTLAVVRRHQQQQAGPAA